MVLEPLRRGRVASWVREASRPGGNLSQYETFVGIAGSAGTVGNYMRPAEAYAQKMTQCQVIVATRVRTKGIRAWPRHWLVVRSYLLTAWSHHHLS